MIVDVQCDTCGRTQPVFADSMAREGMEHLLRTGARRTICPTCDVSTPLAGDARVVRIRGLQGSPHRGAAA